MVSKNLFEVFMRKAIASYIVTLFAISSNALFAGNIPSPKEIADSNPLRVKTETLQERKTMKIRLDNGLEVFIISDPNANKSAAALAVEVGSWQDPEQFPGTAHFCEHMLFMGSKKYPEEDGFFHRVADSGGSANAYTWTDRTVYAFSSNHKQFCQNLDVFAHFFIDPLFNKGSVQRELCAVNQEFAKNIQNDGWREWQIVKETGNQNHPNSKFSTGNEDTLRLIPIETLANWYGLHYSADRMHLVVYTNQDLSVMRDIINQSFHTVPKANAPSIPFDQVLSEDQKGSVTYIEPIRDLRSISFTWEMSPEVAGDVDAKIPELLAYTLSCKGEGSLFESLYKQNFADSVDADILHMRSDQVFLQLSISLTKSGVNNIDQIIEETFASIKQLQSQGVPHHIFQEMKQMGEIKYTWQQRIDEFEFAMSSASKMIDENLETYPYKTRVIQTIKPGAINATLANMSPKNTMFIVMAPSSLTKITPDKCEKWLGGKYRVVAIEEERIEYLTHLPPDPKFHTPAVNPFIPEKLTVRNNIQKPEKIRPTLMSDDSFGKCYFIEDEHYLAPEIVMKFGMKSPAICPEISSYVMTDMAVEMLERKLITTTSEARRAGIQTHISQDNLKFEFNVRGPSNKCLLVMNKIANGIKTSCPTREEFELVKESLVSEYKNREKALAFTQAREMMISILYNDCHSAKDLGGALNNISYDDYLLFNEELIQSSYVEGVIGGNLSQSEALTYWSSLKKTLNPSIYPISEHNQTHVTLLSNDSGPYTISVRSEMQGNASLLMIQIPTNSIGEMASRQVLAQVLWSSFFDTLRTRQQTGYITKAWTEEHDGKIMLFLGVHSTTHYPAELLARFELYLEEFSRNFENEITHERYSSLKDTVITNLSKPPTNLNNKVGQVYYLAFTRNGDFEKRQRTSEAIQALQYNQFKEDVTSFYSRNNKKRIAIQIEGKSDNENSFSYQQISFEHAKSL